MTSISPTVSAASIVPSLGVHGHAHHKKGAADSADTATRTQSASTEGMLKRLGQTRQEVTLVPGGLGANLDTSA